MNSCASLAEARGCPIRKSPDQSLFAAPRRLSQRITSFIASQCQGIHQMPLSRLIALIINVHPGVLDLGKKSRGWSLKKDLLCFDLPVVSGQASQAAARGKSDKSLHSRCQSAMRAPVEVAKLVYGPPAGCRTCIMDCGVDGGANRDRTDDLKLAKLALSQLSYGPSQAFHRQPGSARSIHGGPGKI